MNGRIWFVVAGLIFSVGLVLSGMTQPDKVSAFLDFAGRWDPSLLFVMGGAVAVYFVAQRLTRRLRKPIFAERFPEPPRSHIDAKLVLGAALFGVGWGLSGLCPGPALVSIGAGASVVLWFVPAMLAGMGLHHVLVERRRTTDG